MVSPTSTLMAEVAIAIPVNLEKTTSEAGQLRRNSTGKLANKASEENVWPNYLRASLGSCHDYCKYGFKRDFKTVTRTPMVKRSTTSPKKSLEPAKPEILEGKSLEPAKAETLQKQKSLYKISRLASNLGISTSPVRKPGIQLSTTKRIVTTNNPEELKQKSLRRKEPTIFTAENKLTSENNRLNGASNTGVNKIDTSQGIGTSKGIKKTYLLPTTSSHSRKIDAKRIQKKKEVSRDPKRDKNISSLSATQSKARKADAWRTSKEISHNKGKVSLRTANIEQPSAENIPEKILYITELSTKTYECLSPERGDGLNEKQPSKIEDVSYTQGTIDSIRSSPSSISLYSDSKASSSSMLTSLLSSSSAAELGKINTRAGKDHSQDGDCSPRKLKFRKGKRNMGILSGANSPRRLKFKQGKLFGESQEFCAEAKRKKIYRKTDVGRVPNAGGNELNEVVLRRRNLEGKRFTQNSYNNVIEETARKLAKTRKSKVKALVGAFETVISLQDDKSSGTVKLP